MKITNILLAALIAASANAAQTQQLRRQLGTNQDSCGKQEDGKDVQITKLTGDAAIAVGCGADEVYHVCITVGTGFGNSKNEAFSHVCLPANDDICWKDQGWAQTTDWEKFGSGLGTGNATQCTYALPDEEVLFVIKDGNGCSTSDYDQSTTTGITGSDDTAGVTCGPHAEDSTQTWCSGNGNAGKECVWKVTMPSASVVASDETTTETTTTDSTTTDSTTTDSTTDSTTTDSTTTDSTTTDSTTTDSTTTDSTTTDSTTTDSTTTDTSSSCNVIMDEQSMMGVKTYDDLPIQISKQEGTSVTFNIVNTWKDSAVSWVATQYTDNTDGVLKCPKEETVMSTESYTAECTESKEAEIWVYMHDGQNDKDLDDASVPAMCNPSNDQGRKVGYKFTLPCTSTCTDTTTTTEDSSVTFGSANAQGTTTTEEATTKTTTDDTPAISFSGANAQGTAETGSGGGYGDPHLKTWRGHVYDFHGECDMVLVSSKNFANGLGLDLHIRTTIRRDWSFISGAAIRIGNDVFEVLNNGQYLWNGETYDKLPRLVGGFRLKHSQTGDRHKYKIDLRGEGKILIKVYNEFLAVTMKRADGEYFRDSVGLMGDFEHGAMIGRDGVSLFDNNPEGFGQEWQVTDKEPQLFKELKGPQFPQKCTIPAPLSVEESRRRLDESMVSREAAVKACADWEEDIETCIYDVMSTGDLGMAQAGAF